MSRESMNRKYASAKERADKHGSGFQAPYLKLPPEVQIFKPKSGVMLIDILPYKVGSGNPWAEKGLLYYERTFWVHRGIGANSDSHLCLARNFKEACPVCEHRLRLMKKDNEDSEELVKDLAPRERQLFNVRNLKEPDKKLVWDISHHLFGKTLDATLRSADEDDDWDNFAHLDGGLTLKVSFAEESYSGRSFLSAETIYFKPRKTDYDESILDEVVCLDKVLVPLDYDELKKLFLQTVDEDEEGKGSKRHAKDDDDDEDEEPKAKKKRDDDDDEEPKSRKSSKDDDDDEEPPKRRKDDDDDEDEEPKGKKSKSDDDDEDKPKKKKRDDDDWDDFDEPKGKKSKDDDEDEEPKKKKRDDDDDDEEPKGKKAARNGDDDDDEEPPKKKRDDDDDDEDEEPKAKKKNRFAKQDGDRGWDEDDDDEKPKKKVKAAKDDDDEDDD